MIKMIHLVCQQKKLKIELGQKLHELRLNRKMSIWEASRKTHVPCFVIDLIELGKSSRIGSIEKLCRLYGKAIKLDLVDVEDPDETAKTSELNNAL